MSEIHYDPQLHLTAGFLEIKKHADNPIADRDTHTLLYLIFWLLYTKEGRGLIQKHKPGAGPLSPDQRQDFKNEFNAKGVMDPAVQNALIDAHEAAENYATAFAVGNTQLDRQEEAEKVYLQKMSFITWCLWEDAKAHEFSLPW